MLTIFFWAIEILLRLNRFGVDEIVQSRLDWRDLGGRGFKSLFITSMMSACRRKRHKHTERKGTSMQK